MKACLCHMGKKRAKKKIRLGSGPAVGDDGLGPSTKYISYHTRFPLKNLKCVSYLFQVLAQSREEIISTMNWDENDEFEIPLTQTATGFHALASVDDNQRPMKKPKRKTTALRGSGKENARPSEGSEILNCSLDFIPSSIDCVSVCSVEHSEQEDSDSSSASLSELKQKGNYLRNSIESKLVVSRTGELNSAVADSDSELGLLMNLCDELEEVDSSVRCPLCDVDISNLTEEQRHLHTNNCLDKGDNVRFTPFTQQ